MYGVVLIRAVAFGRLSNVSDWWVSYFAAPANINLALLRQVTTRSRSATVNSECISFEACHDYDNAQGTVIDPRGQLSQMM
jgi:hypothetical protein